jgi:hypothetical protein
MSEEPSLADPTLLSGLVQKMARDVRLLRLQLDNLAPRLISTDQRLAITEQRFVAVDQRLAVKERSIHQLIGEVSCGFRQMQQQLTRGEKRFDAMNAGLAGPAASSPRVEDLVADRVAKAAPG